MPKILANLVNELGTQTKAATASQNKTQIKSSEFFNSCFLNLAIIFMSAKKAKMEMTIWISISLTDSVKLGFKTQFNHLFNL